MRCPGRFQAEHSGHYSGSFSLFYLSFVFLIRWGTSTIGLCGLSKVRLIQVFAKSPYLAQFCSDSKMTVIEVHLHFNLKGPRFLSINTGENEPYRKLLSLSHWPHSNQRDMGKVLHCYSFLALLVRVDIYIQKCTENLSVQELLTTLKSTIITGGSIRLMPTQHCYFSPIPDEVVLGF